MLKLAANKSCCDLMLFDIVIHSAASFRETIACCDLMLFDIVIHSLEFLANDKRVVI